VLLFFFSNSILQTSGLFRSGKGGVGVLTKSTISVTISFITLDKYEFWREVSKSFLHSLFLSKIIEFPVSLSVGIALTVGGLHLNAHSSLKIPVIFDKKAKMNFFYSPGLITFYS
jgi:hypothetical protein